MTQSWDQQPGEPALWYGRFTTFRLLGTSRSVEQAFRDNTGQNGTSHGRWREESLRWKWVERAEAWDRHELERTEAGRLVAVEAMHERHLAIAVAALDKVREVVAELDVSKLAPEHDRLLKWLVALVELETTARTAPILAKMQAQIDTLTAMLEGRR